MKLTKLLLLAPAFMMLACTKAPANVSSSTDPTPVGPETTVNKETWDDQINWAGFLKPGQNKTIAINYIDLSAEDETKIVWTEMDGEAYRAHSNQGKAELYVSIDSTTLEDGEYDFTLYGYDEMAEKWITQDVRASLITFAYEVSYFPFSLDFKEFTYDEEEKAYVAKSFDLDYKGVTLIISDATIEFADGVMQSLEFTLDGDVKYEITTSKVGKTKVTLPEVE